MFGWFRRSKLSTWVKKTDIAYMITKAKIEEAVFLNRVHAQAIKDLTENKDLERIGEVEELKAANKRLADTLDSQKKKMKYVEAMRINVVTEAKRNAQITGDLKGRSTILRDHILQFYGLAEGIDTDALTQLVRVESIEELK